MSVGLIDSAIKIDGLKPTDKLILILLANCTNEEKETGAFVQDYLVERSGLTRNEVDRAIERLIKAVVWVPPIFGAPRPTELRA